MVEENLKPLSIMASMRLLDIFINSIVLKLTEC
ncbi:hypothetical protein IK1_02290 [Bacillus cereus VD146]|uniref:Uncharacterized protein n=1 Tax=Bacillus cereus (strain VD146) TaxID=1053236 RepID=R8MZT8_BACCX|nr:hypothetical protein IK1_02290 [Bacillus cereus VD146]